MGYQLWTSPITGYRRRGTRLSDLRSVIGDGITARAILEPLQACHFETPALEIARVLKEREFDVVGVQRDMGGPIVAYATAESLRVGQVGDHMLPLRAEDLVSDSTPLPRVLSALRNRPRVFVLGGAEVGGIVTRTDLNKPPLRIYLFGLISLLEMHLGFWVRAEYADSSWIDELAARRLEKAREVERDRKSRGQECELVECLQLCDKRDLLLRRSAICKDLGLVSKSEARKNLNRAQNLRNLLAHSQPNLVQGSSWEEVIDLTEWIEQLVHRSDDRVEACAAMAARQGQADLWSAA